MIDSCRSFSNIEAITQSFPLLFAIAFKSKKRLVERAMTIERAIEKEAMSQCIKLIKKNKAKKLRVTTFTIARVGGEIMQCF